MIIEARVAMLGVCLFVPLAIAWSGPDGTDPSLYLQPQSRLWVEGTSTVRSFECAATSLNVTVTASTSGAVAAVLAGDKAINTVVVAIPAARLDCVNDTMNEHMHKALKASQHENVEFRLSSYDLSAAAGETRARLTGTLQLGGSAKQVSIDVTTSDAGNGILRVTGAHVVSMGEYGLTAPRLMLGTLRVHDRVTVKFDLFLKA